MVSAYLRTRFVCIMIIVHRKGLDEFVPARDDPEELSIGGSLLGSPASVSVSPHKAARSARQL